MHPKTSKTPEIHENGSTGHRRIRRGLNFFLLSGSNHSTTSSAGTDDNNNQKSLSSRSLSSDTQQSFCSEEDDLGLNSSNHSCNSYSSGDRKKTILKKNSDSNKAVFTRTRRAKLRPTKSQKKMVRFLLLEDKSDSKKDRYCLSSPITEDEFELAFWTKSELAATQNHARKEAYSVTRNDPRVKANLLFCLRNDEGKDDDIDDCENAGTSRSRQTRRRSLPNRTSTDDLENDQKRPSCHSEALKYVYFYEAQDSTFTSTLRGLEKYIVPEIAETRRENIQAILAMQRKLQAQQEELQLQVRQQNCTMDLVAIADERAAILRKVSVKGSSSVRRFARLLGKGDAAALSFSLPSSS